MPTVNQMLYLRVAASNPEESEKEYKARIADAEGDTLLIETPIHEPTGRLKKLLLGDELSIYYINETGIKHFFDSHVLGFRDDQVRLVKIRKPDPERITKVQRRNFLRVPAELELAVLTENRERFIAVTDDVGGGVSFLCDSKRDIQVGQRLDCWILLNYKNGAVDHAPFASEVVRIVEMGAGRKQVMSKFTTISDSDRQKIIRYCFERQFDFRNR
ncbi:flagellar brake protein [Paenibacillus thailandensis]|uniref:Flagellar brake protein n=1 Tax=Paenibacillus thailandensis TaxID=393250 RepID=A0ABW5R0S5_9BACL